MKVIFVIKGTYTYAFVLSIGFESRYQFRLPIGVIAEANANYDDFGPQNIKENTISISISIHALSFVTLKPI